MKRVCCYLDCLVALLTSGIASAYTIEFNENSYSVNGEAVGDYENDVPRGWTYYTYGTGIGTGFTVDGIHSLRFNLWNSYVYQYAELRMGDTVEVPSTEIACDNIVGNFMFYAQPSNNKTPDTFQLIATTNNNWNQSFTLGRAVPIRDDSYVTGWTNISVKATITGITQRVNYDSLKIGIRVSPGGFSSTYGFLHGFSIKFVACATPDKSCMLSSMVDSPDIDNSLAEEFDPGTEYGRIAAVVEVSPVEKVSDLEVWGVLSRDNGARTLTASNRLYSTDGRIYYERLEDAQTREWFYNGEKVDVNGMFDAGETITCSTFTKYKSNDPLIPPLGKDEFGNDVEGDVYAYEYSSAIEYTVGKRGSAWINEFGKDSGETYVELCGTTNRTYMGGWEIVLSDVSGTYARHVFTNAFDFTANMSNGFNSVVGVEVCKLENWSSIDLENATLELKNSAGVVEFSATNITLAAHYQMTGVAKWDEIKRYAYDWTGTGTSTNGPFSFESTSASLGMGECNLGQRFIVPVKAALEVIALLEDGLTPLSDAFVTVVVGDENAGILNGESGAKLFEGRTGTNGSVNIPLDGFSDAATNIPINVSVSAFAWKSADTNLLISLVQDIATTGPSTTVTNYVRPIVAYDDFQQLNTYWEPWTSIIDSRNYYVNWYSTVVSVNGVNESVLQLNTGNAYVGDATLTSSGFMSLRNKRYLHVSFRFRNERKEIPGSSDTLTIVLADTHEFTSITCETVGLANKSEDYNAGDWYPFEQFIEVPMDFAKDGRIWIRIKGHSKGFSYLPITFDKLRVAAVDSVNINSLSGLAPTDGNFQPSDVMLDITPLTGGIVTNYVSEIVGYHVATNGVDAGTFSSLVAYEAFLAGIVELDGEIVVSTITNSVQVVDSINTNYVREVAADLMMKINGGEEFVIPFKFEGGVSRANISAVINNIVLTNTHASIASAIARNRPEGVAGFLPGDTVEYYARVTYDPDDADEDEYGNLGRDIRYFPNNSVPASNGWYIKGGYLPMVQSFSVDGPDISNVGDLDIADNGITLMYHAWDESVITNLTVSVKTNGIEILSEEQATNGTARVTNTFTTDRLKPNTDYVLTISGNSIAGKLTTTNFAFTTLPVVTTATIMPEDAQGSVKLTIVGEAVEYFVSSESGTWTKSDASGKVWALSGRGVNEQITATVTGTNKTGTAQLSAIGYTRAAAATTAPDAVTNTVTVTVGAPSEMATDGNPSYTEYAIRVSNSADSTEKYVSTNGVPVWKPLAAWKSDGALEVGSDTVNLAATNYFSFVTRNGTDKASTTMETVATATNECWFVMTAGFDGKATQRTASSRADSDFGKVDYTLVFFDPARSEGATAVVEYSLDGGNSWATNECFSVPFAELGEAESFTTNLVWTNTWAAVGNAGGTHDYKLRATVTSGGRSAQAMLSGTLDFAPPTDLVITDTLANGAYTQSRNYGFTFSANDATNIIYRWTLGDASGSGNAKSGENLSDGSYTITVWAKDSMGNESAQANWSWTVDNVKPVMTSLTGAPDKDGIITNEHGFAFAVTATDTDPVLTYHWLLNGEESSAASTAGTVEGTNTMSVYARDRAGNTSDPTNRTWVVDTRAPQNLTITQKPDTLTKEQNFTFTATAEDATVITYHWTLVTSNGNIETNETEGVFSGTLSRDGDYSVTVYATDAVGNSSVTKNYGWTLDATPPTGLGIDGTPAQGTVTKSTDFSFTAVNASDAHGPLTYRWVTNGVVAIGATLPQFSGVAAEGTNTMSVAAIDAVGNASSPVPRTWVVDTIAPQNLAFTQKPDALTSVSNFTFAAYAEDATALTYHWSLNGVAATSVTLSEFSGVAAEGENTVTVYATDEGGNASITNSWTWTLDTVKPTVTHLTAAVPECFNARTFTATVTFSEPVTGFEASDVQVDNCSVSEVNGSGATYSFTVTPNDEGVVSVQIKANAVNDLAGNGNEASPTPLRRTYDKTLPTVALSSASLDPFNAAAAPWLVTVTFSEPVTNFTSAAVTVGNGSVTRVTQVQGSDVAYTVEIAPANDGQVSVSIPAGVVADAAGNGNEASSPTTLTRTYDKTMPTVGLSSTSLDPFNAAAAPWMVTVTFSEPVTNFTASSLNVENGNVRAVSGSATTYTVTIDPIDNGAVVVGVKANGAFDAAGNGNEASQTPLTRTYDGIVPTVLSITSAAPDYFNTDTLSVTVAFSEPVTNFTATALTVVNGSVSSVSGSGTTYTVTIKPDEEDSVRVSIPAGVVADLAGNKNEASPMTLTRTYDATPPAVNLASDTPDYFNEARAPLVVTVAFSEPVTNFTAASVVVSNGTNVTVSEVPGSTTNYVVTVEPITDGIVSVQIEAGVVADAAGNGNEVSVPMTLTRTYDTTNPTVTLASETTDRFNGDVAELLVTVKFSESVTNFTAGSVSVSNGTVTAVSDVEVVEDEYVYTVTVIPDSNGEVIVNVASNVVADAAGNGNEASNELTFIYDDVSPTVTLSSGTPARFNAAQMVVNVTFSEPVTNFTAASVAVSNGTNVTVSEVPGSTTNYVVTVEPIADGVVSVQIEAGVVADLAGNQNEESAPLTRTYDTTPPDVELASDTRDPFNADDVFTVKVAFNEAVTNFTTNCVTVINGTATEVSDVEVVDGTNTYTVTISPAVGNDVTVSVQIAANAVTDLAGNGNTASEPLTRTCDTKRPTVTFSAKGTNGTITGVIGKGYLIDGSFIVTLTFDESVTTNSLSNAVTVSNGIVNAFTQVHGSDVAWEVTISPTIADTGEGIIAVQVEAGAFFDAAGNGNEAGVKTWIYDNQKPHDIQISGTPENGATIRGRECRVELTASATDVSGISGWGWKIYRDGVSCKEVNYKAGMLNVSEVFSESGTYTVSVRPRDGSGLNNPTSSDWTEPSLYSWTFVKDDTVSDNVEFGHGICVKVDPQTGATNTIRFTSVDFRPGETSTFVLSGFDVSDVSTSETPLTMSLVVRDTLGGTDRRESVNATLNANASTTNLTVTLPAAATQNKDSLFIIGIDNK